MTLVDSCTNTSPMGVAGRELPGREQAKKLFMNLDDHESSSYSSQDDNIYKKYWTDDMEEVHQNTLQHTRQITQKIDEALQVDSPNLELTGPTHATYKSQEAPVTHTAPEIVPDLTFAKDHMRNKSDDADVRSPLLLPTRVRMGQRRAKPSGRPRRSLTAST